MNQDFNVLLARVVALEALIFALANNEKTRGDALRQKFAEARFSLETSLLHKGDSEEQIARIGSALDKIEVVMGWKDQ